MSYIQYLGLNHYFSCLRLTNGLLRGRFSFLSAILSPPTSFGHDDQRSILIDVSQQGLQKNDGEKNIHAIFLNFMEKINGGAQNHH